MSGAGEGQEAPVLDPHVRAFVDQLAQAGAPKYGEQPIPEQRAAMAGSAAGFFGPIPPVPWQDLAVPGPGGDVPVRVYRPVEGPAPVLVWLHGGGWVLGNLETVHGPCATLAEQAGCVVVSVDYRLAPEHPFPAALEDAWAVVEWVREHGEQIGAEPGRLAIGGDSSGGNIAAVIARRARDAGVPLALQLLVYPVCDADFDNGSYTAFQTGYWLTREAMVWFFEQYAPGLDWLDPEISPLRAADLAGVAPAHVITAECDVLRDEGEAYGRRLQEVGVPATISRHAGMVHGFFRLPAVVPHSREALAEAAGAIREAFAR